MAVKIQENMEEMQDKERRKLNIIMENVPEVSSEDENNRKEGDIKVVAEIFSKDLELQGITPLSITRLGRLKEKVRPIRICLDSENSKQLVLSAAKKLRNSPEESAKRIYIDPDLTQTERKRNFELRQELRKRRNEGEENIVIYAGKIVKKSNLVVGAYA